MRNQRGFTILELTIAVFVIGGFLALLLLPSFVGIGRKTSRQMQNNTQLRGLGQAFVLYSQANGGHYPGLKQDGSTVNLAVEHRLFVLVDQSFIAPGMLINPAETDPAIQEYTWRARNPPPFTADHHSYALLQVPAQGARRAEWHDTIHADAVVAADRNTGSLQQPQSIWSGHARAGQGAFSCSSHGTYRGWAGGLAFNDNHVRFEAVHRFDLEYDGIATRDDHLFEAVGDDDAYLIHSGN